MSQANDSARVLEFVNKILDAASTLQDAFGDRWTVESIKKIPHDTQAYDLRDDLESAGEVESLETYDKIYDDCKENGFIDTEKRLNELAANAVITLDEALRSADYENVECLRHFTNRPDSLLRILNWLRAVTRIMLQDIACGHDLYKEKRLEKLQSAIDILKKARDIGTQNLANRGQESIQIFRSEARRRLGRTDVTQSPPTNAQQAVEGSEEPTTESETNDFGSSKEQPSDLQLPRWNKDRRVKRESQLIDQNWLNDFTWRIHKLFIRFDAWEYVGETIRQYTAASDAEFIPEEGPVGVPPLFLGEKPSIAAKYATLAAIHDHCHEDLGERLMEEPDSADPWSDDPGANWPGQNWRESHTFLMLKVDRVPQLQHKHCETLERYFDEVAADLEEQGQIESQPASSTDKKRPCFARDHLFLKWHETDGDNTYHRLAPIRDKWNDLPENKREDIAPKCSGSLPKGRCGTDRVKTAIKKARKEL